LNNSTTERMRSQKMLPVNELAEGILAKKRVVLGQAITRIESRKKEDQEDAKLLIEKLLPFTGNSIRIGITGAPGVGKSTFIETFGKYVTDNGKKIAVLAIDPSSSKSKGSILGDKTRMENLSRNPNAFIRPTPAGDLLGGVANNTRETILLCEAAGFDVIIVETVGVGQSEVTVRSMVDFFLLLMLAGAGDELQGIKKGIMEMADAIVITKADHDDILPAQKAKSEYQNALHLFEAAPSGWIPKVITSSAITSSGIDEVWSMIENYREKTLTNGYLNKNREEQDVEWFRSQLKYLIESLLFGSFISIEEINLLENRVKQKDISPIQATQEVMSKLKKRLNLSFAL
jgi:LAO/AO transport system kinase